ncbi:MAG TPA: hypothetical protein VGG01_22675 [Xanthobacteraceae bacterium]|jgi:hypothetical protein
MRNFIKIAAIAGALLGCVTVAQAQSSQQGSTEAGIDNAQNHGAFGGYAHRGAYAQYRGHYGHHRHHVGW